MTTRVVSVGFLQVQGIQQFQLLRGGCREPVYSARTDFCLVALNAGEQIKSGAWACAVALRFQAHAHDAVEDQGQSSSRFATGNKRSGGSFEAMNGRSPRSWRARGCGRATGDEPGRSLCRI